MADLKRSHESERRKLELKAQECDERAEMEIKRSSEALILLEELERKHGAITAKHNIQSKKWDEESTALKARVDELQKLSTTQEEFYNNMKNDYADRFEKAKSFCQVKIDELKKAEARCAMLEGHLDEKTKRVDVLEAASTKSEAAMKKLNGDLVTSKSALEALEAAKMKVEATLERELANMNVLNAQLLKSETEAKQLHSDNVLQRGEMYDMRKQIDDQKNTINTLLDSTDASMTWCEVDACEVCKKSFMTKIASMLM